MKYCLLVAFLLGSAFVALAGEEIWVTPVGTDYSGNGTAGDPYVCSSQASFDALMNNETNIPANSIIHLMAGKFLTDGYIPLQAGWKIRGSGMDVTTIQQVALSSYPEGDTNNGVKLSVFWSNYSLNGIEISDMTIDCNLQNQTLPNCVVGAISLLGGDSKLVESRPLTGYRMEWHRMRCNLSRIGRLINSRGDKLPNRRLHSRAARARNSKRWIGRYCNKWGPN